MRVTWRLYWMDLFVLLLFGSMTPGGASENTFQYGIDGYESAGEVGIHSGIQEICYGQLLMLYDGNTRLLFKFDELDLPQGEYTLKFQLSVSSLTQPGTASVYILHERRWEDPGETMNPPTIDQNYPTWNYWNYNLDAWETPGADGATEKGDLIGQQYIDSVTEVTFEKQITMEPNQTGIGFLVYGPGRIHFYCKENNEGIIERNPKLTLIGGKRLPKGGLGWNQFFEPMQGIR